MDFITKAEESLAALNPLRPAGGPLARTFHRQLPPFGHLGHKEMDKCAALGRYQLLEFLLELLGHAVPHLGGEAIDLLAL